MEWPCLMIYHHHNNNPQECVFDIYLQSRHLSPNYVQFWSFLRKWCLAVYAARSHHNTLWCHRNRYEVRPTIPKKKKHEQTRKVRSDNQKEWPFHFGETDSESLIAIPSNVPPWVIEWHLRHIDVPRFVNHRLPMLRSINKRVLGLVLRKFLAMPLLLSVMRHRHWSTTTRRIQKIPEKSPWTTRLVSLSVSFGSKSDVKHHGRQMRSKMCSLPKKQQPREWRQNSRISSW